MMINLFSLEILIGLAVGLIIGWFLKNLLTKDVKSVNDEDLASKITNLTDTINDYQKENSKERGAI
mgnify:FL=1